MCLNTRKVKFSVTQKIPKFVFKIFSVFLPFLISPMSLSIFLQSISQSIFVVVQAISAIMIILQNTPMGRTITMQRRVIYAFDFIGDSECDAAYFEHIWVQKFLFLLLNWMPLTPCLCASARARSLIAKVASSFSLLSVGYMPMT